MAVRIIAHAVLTWPHDRKQRTLFRGDLVDLPPELEEYFDQFGAFEPLTAPDKEN